MADFRRWFFALAVVLVAFTGLANAQMTCTASVPSAPFVRSEGFTELIGDILITCTGSLPAGTAAPTVGSSTAAAANTNLQGSITVFLNAPITSRLLGGTTMNLSEATLLIDDPGTSTTAGTPQAEGVVGCTVTEETTAGGAAANCAQTVGTYTSGGSTIFDGSAGPNAFPGLINSGNLSVTFSGIPVIPPGSTGASVARTFRITNVRVNANALSAGSITGATPITATVLFTSNAQGGLVVNGGVTPAFAATSLSTGFESVSTGIATTSASGLLQCNTMGFSMFNTNAVFKVLTYTDNFPTAFKVRQLPGQGTPGNSLLPGSESGFIPSGTQFVAGSSVSGNIFGGTGTFTPGLADYGTRVKAIFTGIPTNATIWVPTANTMSNGTSLTTLNTVQTAPSATAVLVASETAGDGANGAVPVPVAGTQTDVVCLPSGGTCLGTITSTTGLVTYVPLPNVNGSSTAVWEVTNATPGAPAQLNFPVAIVFNSGTSTSNPVSTGSIMVTQEYAPTPASLAFTATAGAAPSGSLTVPRFNDTGTAKVLANVSACRTVLLFPFVATTAGFETGLAISNTSQDPFGTAAQAGACTLNFYGSGAPTTAPVTPSVSAGTTWANNTGIGLGVTNFSGYLIALCNFQYAHGYAAIFNGFGTTAGVFSSYLAEVIPDPQTTTLGRSALPFSGFATAPTSEILGH